MFPLVLVGLMLASCFLLVPNRMAQVRANNTEANAKGFLGFLSEDDPGITATSKGGAPGIQWGQGDPVGKPASTGDLLSSTTS